MELVNEMMMNGKCVKYYKNDFGNNDPVEVLTQLNDNGLEVGTVHLVEDAELDMKMHIGDYSFEQFCSLYPSLVQSGPYLVSTDVDYDGSQVYISINDGSSVMYIETQNNCVELTDMLEKDNSRR